jgi:hypothetical protein
MHLPDWMRLPILDGEADANNSTSFKLVAGPDDIRTVVSYPATTNVAIDQVGTHTQLDEFARMPGGGEGVWVSVETTVSPIGGTLHIVTRGAGPNYAARLFNIARSGKSRMGAFFAPYDARPGRKGDWYAQEAEKQTQAGIWQFAPRTWQEALQGDESYVYPMFENPPGRHVVGAHPCELSACKRIAVGIDPGGVHPTAMGLWGERSSGRAHLYEEFYRTHIGAGEIEAQLVEWEQMAGRRIYVVVPQDEPTLLATLVGRGFWAGKANVDKNAGITLCTERLNTNGVTVHAGCVHHIDEFQDYRNPSVEDKTTRVVYAGDRPVKHHADCMDCMRYSLLALAQWPRESVAVRMPDGRVYAG